MVNKKVLLSYLEVTKNLELISEIEVDEFEKIIEFKTIKNDLVYLNIEGYERNKHIYLNIKRYLNESKVERIETTRTFWELEGNELEHFNLILTEINKFDKLFNNYNY